MDEVMEVIDPAQVGGGLARRHVVQGEGGQELKHVLIPLLYLYHVGVGQ